MQPKQQLLWPDARPLVERLGRDFFRSLPERPGVYLMRDAGETVLYVGKAKNLRQRLGSYRVANPERMPRRHLRLLRLVVRIELQECADEGAALRREAELLHTLQPRFNRAGTWPGKTRFLTWRTCSEAIEFAIAESPETGWNSSGPMGAGAFTLRAVLARLIWVSVQTRPGLDGLPAGWIQGRMDKVTSVRCGSLIEPVSTGLTQLLAGQPELFCGWMRSRLPSDLLPFEKAVIESDLEFVADSIPVGRGFSEILEETDKFNSSPSLIR